jgi:hypothetical protein
MDPNPGNDVDQNSLAISNFQQLSQIEENIYDQLFPEISELI